MADATPASPTPTEAQKTAYTSKLELRGYDEITSEKYIHERVNPELEYYSKSAAKFKKRYLFMRAATVVCGALVPVLVNLPSPQVKILTTILSLVVVVFVSLESVFHYREQWTNYRSAEQKLRNEYYLFTSKSGVYAPPLKKDDAFMTFVNRIEESIEAENASTLRVMTTIGESKVPEREANPGSGHPRTNPAGEK
jgi:hypothetical protein